MLFYHGHPFKGPSFQMLKPIIVALCGFVYLATAVSAMAQEARLKNITISSTDDRMLVSMQVEGAFPPEMIDAILNEVTTKFTFLIRLYRNRSMWLSETLVSLNLTHSLTYDKTRKEFVVYRSWARGPSIVTHSFSEARALMTQIDGIDILPLAQMQRDEGYELRAKAELSKMTLPFYLHYVFYFVTFWDFETDWHSVSFIY
ncbi:MAG: DUF4390 domain-containing protein [Desulfosarcina sp.]|nr:DUF4390 domain-containing protein [Desulfobacterales bacterium]